MGASEVEGLDDQQVMHAMGIDDAYRVERVLASGAGGVTELVTLDGSGPFVRKRIPSKLARRGVWATLVECDCPRLPRVEATYEMPDEFVVVIDFVPGENLEQLVAERGRLAERDARELVAQLCDAAAALHAHGIIHRDISPRNVVVAADGAHLIDLGIARFRSAGATHDTTQLGTPGFASPEQHGFAQTDARSDVYSLGRLLGYLLTGAMPDVPEAAEYEGALADERVVGPEVRAIVRRASAMEPSARYQSAAELAAVLRGERAPEEAPSPTPEPPAAARREPYRAPEGPGRPRRRWPIAVLAAVVAVALVVAAVLLLSDAGLPGLSSAGDGGSGTPASSQAEKDDGAGAGTPDAGSGYPSVPGDATGGAPAAADVDLEIAESGWSVDEQGYVHYAVALRNPTDAVVDFPAYTVTGRDESGAVLFSDEQVLSTVGPGETVWWGGQAGNGGQPPATVEFSANGVRDYQVGSGATDAASFSVSDVRALPDGFGGTNVVGEVTCERADGSGYGGDVALSVVLRDEAGAIVYGTTGYATRPAPGESTSFEVNCYSAPDYASFEVYALEW